MWSAIHHATLLPSVREALYRSARRDVLDEILELLAENDASNLKHAAAEHVQGPKTWARLAGMAADMLRRPLLHGDADAAAEACEQATLLERRLQARDGLSAVRVTADLRERITRIVRLAQALAAAMALRDGEAPDDASVGRLLALRQRWYGLLRSGDGAAAADKRWVVTLVNAAAARVLQSAAHASLKGLAGRAVVQWTPPPEPDAKRVKLSDGRVGESLTWDDDDDL